MSLPYENATSGESAISEIRKILSGFKVTSFGHMEDFATGDLIIQFEWNGRKVTVKANSKGYAAAWLKENPHSNRSRSTLKQHEDKALKQGKIAVYSILRDWIKGQITAVRCGIFTFEAAFLGNIMLPSGDTIYEHFSSQKYLASQEVP